MSFISKWKDKIARDLEDKVDRIKLDFIQKTSSILGYLIFSFIMLFLVLGILIFAGLGLSEVFADMLDSRSGGYFATMAVFFVLIAILYLLRKPVGDSFSGLFISLLTKQEDKDDDDDDDKDENNDL
jgi:hypothetical protein